MIIHHIHHDYLSFFIYHSFLTIHDQPALAKDGDGGRHPRRFEVSNLVKYRSSFYHFGFGFGFGVAFGFDFGFRFGQVPGTRKRGRGGWRRLAAG